MTPAHPSWRTAIVLLALLGGPGAALADVRTESPKIATLIDDAASRSKSFRALATAIDAARGIVYVKAGRCGRARACLLHQVTVAGGYRVLTIVIDPERSAVALIGAIAHELQHALEVLGDARTTSDRNVFAFYRMRGLPAGGLFETRAAVEKADAVRRELRR